MNQTKQTIQKPTNELSLHPYINQTYCDESTIAALVGSIREVGILEPIKITAQNQVVDGRHRWLAAKRLQLDIVPCQLISDQEAEQTALIIVNSFLSRRHCTPSQIAYTIARLIPEAFEESRRRQLAALQKGSAPVSGISANEVKSVKEWADFLGIDDEYLQQAHRLHKAFAADTLKRTLTDSDGVTETDKTLLEFFEPRIMRKTPKPYSLGAVLARISEILDAVDNHEKSPDTSKGVLSKEMAQQLNLFNKVLATEIVRWNYWDSFDESAKGKHWKYVRSQAALLPPDRCQALAIYHKKLAQTFRKALKSQKNNSADKVE